jgi:uncharacterized protein
MSRIDLGGLRDHVYRRFALPDSALHGPAHWERVEACGLFIAQRTGADEELIRLFALFHDACRENDSRDPQHGPRGAALVREVHEAGLLPGLERDRLETLHFAITHHTHTIHHPDPTIGACWDADRLDLVRFGIVLDPALLNTEPAILVARGELAHPVGA